jgi:hypothetical protein
MAQAAIHGGDGTQVCGKGHGQDFFVLPQDALLAVDDQASNT